MIKNGTLEVSPVAAMGVGNPQEETGCLHLSLRVSVHQLGRFLPAAQYLYKWRVLGRCGGQGWWCLGRAGVGRGLKPRLARCGEVVVVAGCSGRDQN